MGRSGHGKSTLINALANREVAVVGEVKPTTTQLEVHQIVFEDVHAAWEVVDSRGIFEATRPDGAPGLGAVEQVQEDMLKHKPDVILHAVAARETRSTSEDIRVGREIRELISGTRGRAADGDRVDADRLAQPGPRMAAGGRRPQDGDPQGDARLRRQGHPRRPGV